MLNINIAKAGYENIFSASVNVKKEPKMSQMNRFIIHSSKNMKNIESLQLLLNEEKLNS
jgi:hypothetical protein